MTPWRKVLLALVPSLVVLVVAGAVATWAAGTGTQAQLALLGIPVVLTGAGLFAALRFSRSRFFFGMLTLLLAWSALVPGAPGGFADRALFHAVCVLLPLNLLVFALIDERGVFTRPGMLRFLFLFLQGVFVLILLAFESEKLVWLLSMPLFSSALTRAIDIAPPGLLVLLVALLTLHGRLVLEPVPERAAFFGAAIATSFALYDGVDMLWTGTMLGAAGVMMLVALLQTSWRMAFLDELTGVPGRRALEDEMRKLGDVYSIAMVDVDHFKRFNDTWGHEAGDEVLRMVAARLVGVEGGGKVYRFGGEEFTIVFPGKEVRDTLAALGALRKSIADDPFVIRKRDRRYTDSNPQYVEGEGREVNITVSIGVADSSNQDSPHEVLRAADKQLYKAKENGRNQVCR